MDDQHHRRRIAALVDRLPERMKAATVWLLRPEARWVRIPAGLLFISGGFLGMLPILGFWMLPLGVILIAEDVPIVRRGLRLVFDWLEKRRPHWFKPPAGD